MKIHISEKLLWKYVLYCLNNKNCCLNNTTKHIHIFSLFFIKQSQLTTQHKPINLEQTHQIQNTKNETSRHFGPSTNPLNWEWTQQLFAPNQHKPNPNSNRPKSTTQISLNPAQKICKPTQITNPTPNPNFPPKKKGGPNLTHKFTKFCIHISITLRELVILKIKSVSYVFSSP